VEGLVGRFRFGPFRVCFLVLWIDAAFPSSSFGLPFGFRYLEGRSFIGVLRGAFPSFFGYFSFHASSF
jgi:hypothetical protein